MAKGTLIINGIDYSNAGGGGSGSGGGGNASEVTLTKEEYDALDDSKLLDDISYYITDYVEEGNPQTLFADDILIGSEMFESYNVKGALEEVFQSVSDGKQKIVAALTDKGIEATINDSFEELANKILQIGE